MSFARKVKEELCHIPAKKLHCQKAELAAVIDLAGNLEISARGGVACSLRTTQVSLARRVYRLINEDLGLSAQLFSRPDRLRRDHSYLVSVRGGRQVEALFSLLQKGDLQAAMLPQSSRPLLKRDCCRHAYLRGAFLAGGSVNDPSSGAYHLELVAESELHTAELRRVMTSFRLHPHQIERKGTLVVYLKDRMEIADFLTIIGAMSNRLAYEEVLLNRELRNEANRQRNFLLANIDRTVVASERQQEAILWLERHPALWQHLSPQLLEVATARLDEPESTLQDLAENLGLSKSAVNHRLRKLCQIAEESGWRRGE